MAPSAILEGKTGLVLNLPMAVKIYVEIRYIYVKNDDWLAHVSSCELYGYRDLIGQLMLKGE